MDRRRALRDRIIATYWDVHHEKTCGRCDEPAEDEPRDGPVRNEDEDLDEAGSEVEPPR